MSVVDADHRGNPLTILLFIVIVCEEMWCKKVEAISAFSITCCEGFFTLTP